MDDNIQKLHVSKNKVKKKKMVKDVTTGKNLGNKGKKLNLKKKKKKVSIDKKIAHKMSDDDSEIEICDFSDNNNDSDDLELRNDIDKFIKSLNFGRFAAHNKNTNSSSRNEETETDVRQPSKAKKLKKTQPETENQTGSNTTILTGKETKEINNSGEKDSKLEFKLSKILKKSKGKNKKYSEENSDLNSDPSNKIEINNKQKQKIKNKKKLNENELNIDKNYALPETADKETKKTKKESATNELKKCVKDAAEEKKNEIMEKVKKQLQSASFRLINEQLYTSSGTDAYQMFQKDPESFRVYHDGYNQQVSEWPVNPLNLMVSWLRKKPRNWVIADFGCGKATLAKSLKQKVYSLDLIASVPNVIKCNMAHTPLESGSVNVVVFCLSLMGTNLTEFIVEANRVLVNRGVLKIAEIESRFENNVNKFLKVMLLLGFKNIHKNQNQNYFWLFDFIKIKSVNLKSKLPELQLKPCMYKKR